MKYENKYKADPNHTPSKEYQCQIVASIRSDALSYEDWLELSENLTHQLVENFIIKDDPDMQDRANTLKKALLEA